MKGVKIDKTGRRFGVLLVMKRHEGYPTFYKVRCQRCGKTSDISDGNLGRCPSYCRHCHNSSHTMQNGSVRGGYKVLCHISRKRKLVKCLSCGNEKNVSQSNLWTNKFGCRSCAEEHRNKGTGMTLAIVNGKEYKLPDCTAALGVSRQRVYKLAEQGRLSERLAGKTSFIRKKPEGK